VVVPVDDEVMTLMADETVSCEVEKDEVEPEEVLFVDKSTGITTIGPVDDGLIIVVLSTGALLGILFTHQL
jgi:hypothetical protein